MIQIVGFYDHRGMKVVVGDMVAYPGAITMKGKGETSEGTMVINAKSERLRFSRVKSITGGDYGGFADAGHVITITLEVGHV
jgi:hypothetical protein